MKNLIKFIIFLIYTIGIFFVENYIALGCIFAVNLILVIMLRINVQNAIEFLIKLLPFILFTVIVNILFADLNFAVLIGVRLLLVCNISYIYSKIITYMEFAETIEIITYPLKVFGVNPKEVGLIISIALSFMPIMKDEISEIKNVLKVKGINPSGFNMLKNLSLIFKPFFVSVLQRINEVEMSLKSKGYQE